MANKTFALNDETTKNTYGFKVKNNGLKLDRFKANPVMLDGHWNNNSSVLGNWLNLRFEGVKFLAEANFDTEDKDVKKIAGKVDRGFIKGASLGLLFDYQKLLVDESGDLVLTEAEVLEASICPVPSNGNSIRLYDAEHNLLSEEDVRKLCLSVPPKAQQIEDLNKQKSKMEKIVLTAHAIVALASVGVTNAEDVASISQGIVELNNKLSQAKTDLEAEKGKLEALKLTIENEKKAGISKRVALAVTAGKIKADQTEKYEKIGLASPEILDDILDAIPSKKGLNADNKSGNPELPKSVEEFQKMDLSAQLAFKENHPEEYNNLFKK